MQFKKYFTLLFILISVCVEAQINPTVVYTPHFNAQAARYQPSKLGFQSSKLNIQVAPLFGIQAWGANNILSIDDALRLLDEQNVSTEEVDAWVDDLAASNRLIVGTNVQLLAVGLRIHKKNNSDTSATRKELFSVSFDIVERAEANAIFSDVIGKVAWEGNAQYAGQSVNIGNLAGNGFWQREFSLGASAPVWENDLFNIRAGGRLKFIQGMASVYTEKFNAIMTTPESGEMIELNVDYMVNTSIPDDEEDFDAFKGRGFGLGLDLGATVSFQKNFTGTLSILDMGSVKYNQEITNYYRTGNAVFEGVEIDPSGDFENASEFTEAFWEDIEPLENSDAFTMPLPTRLALQFEYQSFKKDKKDREFAQHHAFLTYTQGFKDIGISTKKPQLNLAYTFSLNTRFSIGNSFGFGGVQGFTIGPYLSVSGGAFSFAIGSGNILGAFSQQNARGTDVALNLGLNFK